jgi:hypothetical protein
MLGVFIVDEIEGIMILLGVKPNAEYLNALENLPQEEIIAVRDSYAQEFETMTGKNILVL